ncbi:MAG: flagellar hook-length control protein FliK [Actinobacteria bacterium]|nr:flagellar hook-length control protein FliK [Actinomycetota bacterium]
MNPVTSPGGGRLAVAGGRSTALLEPAPPPAAGGKQPPGPPDTPFAAMLDDHEARTAVAEGQARPGSDPDGGAERTDDDAAPATPRSPDAAALAALLGGAPLPAGARVVAAPQGAGAEPEPGGGRVLSTGEAFREQARGIVVTPATRPIGVPADATALPLRPVSAAAPAPVAASLAIGQGVAAAEGRGEGMEGVGAVAARATRLADVLRTATPAAPAQPPATSSPATVAGRAQGAANGHASAQAATSATPAPPAPAPATPVTPSAATPATAAAPDTAAVPGRAVGLEHAVETVRLALRAGAERGVTHARISLTPRELGTIEVHLRHTADGLVARVVAEHGAAAQQLQQAGAELRRSLEDQGLTLLRLDIGASGEQGGRAAGRRAASERAGAPRRAGGADDGTPDALAATETTSTTTLALPNGALVDVLA